MWKRKEWNILQSIQYLISESFVMKQYFHWKIMKMKIKSILKFVAATKVLEEEIKTQTISPMIEERPMADQALSSMINLRASLSNATIFCIFHLIFFRRKTKLQRSASRMTWNLHFTHWSNICLALFFCRVQRQEYSSTKVSKS